MGSKAVTATLVLERRHRLSPLDVQRSSASRIKIQGSGNGYVNAGLVLRANDNDDYRGLGMFMQNMQGAAAGLPVIPTHHLTNLSLRARPAANHTDSTAQVKHALFSVRNDESWVSVRRL